MTGSSSISGLRPRSSEDDEHPGEAETARFLVDGSSIIEEAIGGTNVGIHFADDGAMEIHRRP